MKSVKTALTMVFNTPRYWIIAIAGAVLFIVLVGSIIYFPLLSFTLQYSGFSSLPRSFIQIFWINNTAWSLTILLGTALLIGINGALILFQKTQMAVAPSGVTGVIGMVLGLLGAGCASCGSIVLSSTLGLGLTTSLLTLLPAQGKEFGVIALVISSLSVYLACRKIANPPACSLKKK